jgi:hypothetical protein
VVLLLLSFAALGLTGCSLLPGRGASQSSVADVPAESQGVNLYRRGDGSRLTLDELEDEAASSPVFVSVDQSQPADVAFFGRNVRLEGGSLATFGAGTDTLYVAVLAGEATADDATAPAGRLLLWTPDRVTPRVAHFDAERYASTTSTDVPRLQQSLSSIKQSQSRLRKFGRLRSTNFNAVSPTDVATFERRRQYLNDASVIRLRFAHDEPAALARAVADSFLDALVRGDAEAAATFLDPVYLDLDAGTPSEAAVREAVASALVRDGRDDLDGAEIRRHPSVPDAFRVTTTGGEVYLLALTPGDGLFFVDGFTRERVASDPA